MSVLHCLELGYSDKGVRVGSAYTCNLDSRGQIHLTANFLLCPVQSLQDTALLCCQRAEDLWCIATHAHEADGGFRVAGRDGLEQNIDSIPLRSESGRRVVSIAAVFAVVDNDHHRFENHLGGWLRVVDDAGWGKFEGGGRIFVETVGEIVKSKESDMRGIDGVDASSTGGQRNGLWECWVQVEVQVGSSSNS